MQPTEDNLIGARELKTDPTERELLLKGAIEADAETDRIQGEDQSGTSPTQESGKAVPSKSADTDAAGALSPETSARDKKPAEQKPRDQSGRFVKQEAGQEQQQQQPQEGQEQQPGDQGKPPKEERDKQRYDRNWERLNRRSQALAERERQIAEAYQRMQQQPAQADQLNRPRFSYQQYLDAKENFTRNAQRLYREGDIEQADEQMRLANEAEQEAYNSYQAEIYQQQQAQIAAHTQQWRANADEILKAHPEYDDESSEEFQDLAELLELHPYLFQDPNGLKTAVDVLEMRKSHAEVSGLREKLQEKDKEIERLNKLLSPHARLETVRHADGQVPFDTLSVEAQRKALEADAARMDAEQMA